MRLPLPCIVLVINSILLIFVFGLLNSVWRSHYLNNFYYLLFYLTIDWIFFFYKDFLLLWKYISSSIAMRIYLAIDSNFSGLPVSIFSRILSRLYNHGEVRFKVLKKSSKRAMSRKQHIGLTTSTTIDHFLRGCMVNNNNI